MAFHKSKFKALLVPSPTAEALPEVMAFLQHYLMGLNFHFYIPADADAIESIGAGLKAFRESEADPGDEFEYSSVESSEAQNRIDEYDYVFLTRPATKLDDNWAKVTRNLSPSRLVDVAWRESSGVESRLTTLAGNLRGLETTVGMVTALSSEIRRLRESIEESVLVGTGPSSRRALEIDMTNRSSIICNTVILDSELMEHLQPDFLCFSDPAYHLGPSTYAREFRKKVKETALRFPKLKILTLRKHQKPLEMMLPELAGRILSVDQGATRSSALNLDLDLAPIVRPYPNILTLLMLPLAASYAQKIRLFGFDGRSDKDSKFWSHGSSVQLNSLLNEHQEFHSGFHSIKYKNYFSEHCQQVEEVVTAIEKKGILIYSESKSNVPALSVRYRPFCHSPKKISARTIISISPAWKDSFGHYESWNWALQLSSSEMGLNFRVFANKSLAGSNPDWVSPALSSQIVRGESVEIDRKQATLEIKHLISRELKTMKGPFVVFLYEGHPADILVWRSLAKTFPNVRFVLNVMWADEEFAPNYRLPRNLTLTGDNDWALAQLSRNFANVSRLPFVSPLLGKNDLARKQKKSQSVKRILWPGQPNQQKGIEELENTVNDLATLLDKDLVEFTWRVPPQRKPNQRWINLAGELEKRKGVEVIFDDKNMTSDEYEKFLSSFDLIVLPYPGFQRSSGLGIDSLASGTTVLTYEDNWISKLGMSPTAVVSVPNAPKSLGSAIISIVESQAIFMVPDRDKDQIRARFSPKSLIHFLSNNETSTFAFGHECKQALESLEAMRRKRLEIDGESTTFSELSVTPHIDSSYPYELGLHMDEAKFVKNLMSLTGSSNKQMKIVDVGAAKGSFFSTFGSDISEVWAIEPHPDRVEMLKKKYSDDSRIKIVQVAISNTMTGTVTLWDSEESWGVSTLQPWLESHQAANEVSVMKLSELELPSDIDILKVDAEGHDLSVIQSLDWSTTNPHVVICEYDDQKLEVGEIDSWEPLVEFLESKGFTILISEWYPIEKYGGNHKWRRMHVESRPSPGSWGNVIGLKHEPLIHNILLSALSKSIEINVNTETIETYNKKLSTDSKSRIELRSSIFTVEIFIRDRFPRMNGFLMSQGWIRKIVQAIKARARRRQ